MRCNQRDNLEQCSCTHEPCPRKGACCECLSYHLQHKQLPACCFPDDAERTMDRSFKYFAELVAQGRI